MFVFSSIKRFRQKFKILIPPSQFLHISFNESYEIFSGENELSANPIIVSTKESITDFLDEEWKIFPNSKKRATSQGSPRFHRSTLISIQWFFLLLGTKISRSVAHIQSALCMQIPYLSFVANEGSSTSRNCSHNS